MKISKITHIFTRKKINLLIKNNKIYKTRLKIVSREKIDIKDRHINLVKYILNSARLTIFLKNLE